MISFSELHMYDYIIITINATQSVPYVFLYIFVYR